MQRSKMLRSPGGGGGILAGRIPWTEEAGRLWSLGLQRLRHDWSDFARMHTRGCEVSCWSDDCLDAERGGGCVCTDGHCLAHCDCWLYDMWVSPQRRARGGAQGKENLTHGQVKLFLCFLPSVFAEPSLEQGGADWAMCNAQVNRAQRPRTCPSWCYTWSLPYRSSTTLLISHMFACVINNACLEKSMCIIVFDLVMNFKAKDSIFCPPPPFLSFQRGRMAIIWKLFSPLSGGELPADLSINMVCVYVVVYDVYTYVYVYTCVHSRSNTHTCFKKRIIKPTVVSGLLCSRAEDYLNTGLNVIS